MLFDVGGVLMTPDPDAVREAVRRFGLHPDRAECIAALHRATLEMDAQAQPVDRTDWAEVNAAVARALGVSHPDEQLVSSIAAVFREAPYVVVPGAADLLSELSGRLSARSDINAHGSIEGRLAAAGICSRSGVDTAPVEIVVDSTIVGVHKPDPAIFEMAFRDHGRPALGDCVCRRQPVLRRPGGHRDRNPPHPPRLARGLPDRGPPARRRPASHPGPARRPGADRGRPVLAHWAVRPLAQSPSPRALSADGGA